MIKNTNKLELYSLYQLNDNNVLRNDDLKDKNVHYFIDSYQRGFRWDKHQMELLLEDLWEFHQKAINKLLKPNEYYCLQPIVVKPKTKEGVFYWEVLDGQQRLTSLKILIAYLLNETKIELIEEYDISGFSISYETRKKSFDFLSDIANKYTSEEKNNNIDYFYMSNAYKTIVEWFDFKKITQLRDKRNFLGQLLADKDVMNPLKVIWYEVIDETDSYEIFTRLNIGKIKLTNSELIKALFLKKENKNNYGTNKNLNEIANDWNYLEQKLQNDELWYFIYKPRENEIYENRIEYIFDLYCDKIEESEEYHSFYEMTKKITLNDDSDFSLRINEWELFKSYFQKIEGWFIDYQFYHLIGYLVAIGYPISRLIKDSASLNKTIFLANLKKLIKTELNQSEENVREMKYNNKLVFPTLLLFNVQTVLSNSKSNYRFPFNLLKIQNWDIEHIRSQNDKELTSDNHWIDWIRDIVEYFTGFDISTVQGVEKFKNYSFEEIEINIVEKIKELECIYVSKDFRKEKLKIYFQFFKEYFHEDRDDVEKHLIYNLTLLDSYTNRSYQNAFYPIKRKRIQENGKYGVFTPICTTNTFMKVYSKKLDNLSYWSKSDAESYLEEIIVVIKPYLN